ncbi:NUDIX domain-containing protein [Streptomyces cyaneofuscatus]|uniref:NUDIX domain-containing protein n=1 Tax=Streptomyces cyaneofuscatus TaxID=66883 RepID=UPI003658809D
MTKASLRHSVRGVILNDKRQILMLRHDLPDHVIWATPGGGIEAGESMETALRRELREEIGLVLIETPVPVWHQLLRGPGFLEGYEKIVQDYFLVHTSTFSPCGTLSRDELAVEWIVGFRWWSVSEIADYRGPDLIRPTGLAGPLSALINGDIPTRPLILEGNV